MNTTAKQLFDNIVIISEAAIQRLFWEKVF